MRSNSLAVLMALMLAVVGLVATGCASSLEEVKVRAAEMKILTDALVDADVKGQVTFILEDQPVVIGLLEAVYATSPVKLTTIVTANLDPEGSSDSD